MVAVRRVTWIQFAVWGSFCLSMTWAGCGGSVPAPATTPATGGVPAPLPETAAMAQADPATTPAPAAIDPNKKETKWIGTVPYDVFYDRPWEIAADNTLLSGTQPTSLTSETPPSPGEQLGNGDMPTPAANPAPAVAGDTVDWAALMPMETLAEEVKASRTRLTGHLQSLKNYNAEYKWIATEGAYLAMLAGVMERHAGEASWKANAKYVRELAAQIYSKAEGTGREPFEATQKAFEDLCTVLDGGQPPEMEAADKPPFADYAYLNELMKWLEPTFNAVKANVNTEARLKEDAASTERQLRALLVVGRVMGSAGYTSAEEEQYQGFVNSFVTGTQDSITALQGNDFAGFQSGLNKVQTSCAECHPVYRGADAGF